MPSNKSKQTSSKISEKKSPKRIPFIQKESVKYQQRKNIGKIEVSFNGHLKDDNLMDTEEKKTTIIEQIGGIMTSYKYMFDRFEEKSKGLKLFFLFTFYSN